ncbi:MAG: HDOD domain-containing protein [Phycisphaeraceae bacterium]
MSGEATRHQSEITLERVLANGSVPTLPVVAMRLLEMTSNPDVKLNEIADLIQNDPGLASKVLKTVNSSFYGLPKPCPSIERAIAMLGLRAVKSLVLGFSMVNLTRDMGESVDLNVFWRHTIISAAAARQVALIAEVGEPDEVFAAALFQDIGVLTMVAAYPDLYCPLLASAGTDHHALLRLEAERFGIAHTEIGAALAGQWKMPEVIVRAISHHHDSNPPDGAHRELIRCVVVGELTAMVMAAERVDQNLASLLTTANAWFGQTQDSIEVMIDKVEQASREIAKLLDQQIGEVPTSQELMQRANERLLEEQLQTQREAEQAQQDALTDGLTGVPNRKRFDALIVQALSEATRNQSHVAVLFSDADKFKFVNDTYGHPCGDAVLVELAKRVTDTVGERGTVCRYGGEEFVVVLPGLDIHRAAEVGEEIRVAIDSKPFVLTGVPGAPDEPLPRSVSVGVAAWSPGYAQVTAEQLTQRADKAVYAAKEAGRNNVKRWGMDTGRRAADQRADEAASLGVPADALPRDRHTHVLLIEDDPLAARLIQTMFEQNNGVAVHCRPDGRSAIEYLRDSQAPGGRMPDLIVCDLNVPGYNGVQIVKALKSHARFSTIPIVMMSASASDAEREACAKIGISNVYDKLEISEDLKGWCGELVRGLQAAA